MNRSTGAAQARSPHADSGVPKASSSRPRNSPTGQRSSADTGDWTVATEPVDSAVAAALWRAYYTEVSDRWYLLHEGHRTDPAELEREIAANPDDGLVPPHGVLLVARYRGEPAGQAGVRLLPAPDLDAPPDAPLDAPSASAPDTHSTADPGTAELKRVFLLPEARGKGGAALLVAAAEDAARSLGARRMILDTRSDLVEARRLYERLGYRETAPHNDDIYAEHWFTKSLDAGGLDTGLAQRD